MDAEIKDSWVGRTLGGRFQILEVIGEGGMGVVYRAKQISVDREVAIKMMHTRAAHDPQWSERFQSEAKACSLLTHPNTVRLYDFGKTTLGNFYMVMELLDGQSLSSVIHAQAPIAPARVLRILMQCCASLSEAHKAGIIHRDIKPDNIFVMKLEGADDFIKLFDFSIAKRSDVAMTAAGIVMGTPQFMSPEQGRGKEIDHRSDLYSLGIVAYYMLCGRLPFHDADAIEVLRMHQTMEVPAMDTDIPSSVAQLVTSCLDKNPARRPATALALLEACKIWLREIDPSLDVASDPILKNTLVTGEPTRSTEPPAAAQPRPSSTVKTMLGASGAFSPTWSNTLPASTPAQTTQPSISVSQQTLIHGGGQGMASAAAVADAEVSDSAQTLLQQRDSNSDVSREVSESKRTSIETPHGPRRSDSEEMRLETELQRHRRPTNRPTVNEFSGSQAPQAEVAFAPGDAPPPSYVNPDEAAMPAAAAASGPQAYGDSFGEPTAQPGRASFLVACLLIALTFGFGAYFLTSTLR